MISVNARTIRIAMVIITLIMVTIIALRQLFSSVSGRQKNKTIRKSLNANITSIKNFRLVNEILARELTDEQKSKFNPYYQTFIDSDKKIISKYFKKIDSDSRDSDLLYKFNKYCENSLINYEKIFYMITEKISSNKSTSDDQLVDTSSDKFLLDRTKNTLGNVIVNKINNEFNDKVKPTDDKIQNDSSMKTDIATFFKLLYTGGNIGKNIASL